MLTQIPRLIVFTATCQILISSAEAGETTAQSVIESGLRFLETDRPALVTGKSCVNCHHAAVRGWSMREAARSGFRIDLDALNTVTDRQLSLLQDRVTQYRSKKWGHSLAMFYAVSLFGEDRDQHSEYDESLTGIILSEQTPEGTWKAAGQFNNQRRPQGEGEEVQTMWGVLALARLTANDEVNAASERARSWLKTAKRGTTIDSRVLRLLLARESEDHEQSQQLLTQLQESQHDDGGWGWQADDESDAWATGMALYALSWFDAADVGSTVTGARTFLASTQKENGSWHVEGKLKKNPEMASYFGTAWAVIGMTRTMSTPRAAAATINKWEDASSHASDG